MSTVQFPISEAIIPDFDSIAKAIKAIKGSVASASDGPYSYFADKFKLASTVAVQLDRQIRDALTSLPVSLGNMRGVAPILEKISEIDEAERAGDISTDKAAIARAQLQARLGTAVSSTLTAFSDATKLSEPAGRLTNYAREIEARLPEAVDSETSNQARATADVERESARLNTLQQRYDKLLLAVEKARGGPTEDLVGLLPDTNELSSLLDVGAADAAAPQVTAVKKAIELAVNQIRNILKLVDNMIEFQQLTELRDEVSKAVQAQRQVTEAAQERERTAKATLTQLETFKTTGESMTLLAAETNKLVTAFSSFATQIQNLDGKPIAANTIEGILPNMESYLEQARKAINNVILT
jgi:hypothetical protein